MRPSIEIAYVLVKQKDGCYHARITAPNTTPIIVGDFPNKREAQAWLNEDRVPVRDLASEPFRKVG
jgi:hypothetical protein